MAGTPGNKNATKGRDWRDALRLALGTYETENVPRGLALRKIADNVVKKALDGDMDCIAEIGNRLDGKPSQTLDLASADDLPAALVVTFVRPAQ